MRIIMKKLLGILFTKEAPSDSSGAPGQVQHGAGAGEACKYRTPWGAAALT